MARKQDAAAVPPAVTKHALELSVAIPMPDGSYTTKIEIQEPELRHRIAAQKERRPTESETFARYISVVCSIPEESAKKIKHRDARRIKVLLDDIKSRGVLADIAKEEEDRQSDGVDLPQESRRTFVLIHPVPTEGAPLTEVTVEEPDLAAGIAVEKFKTDAEQSAALIASCSGLVIPLVSRMKECDVVRIERWLNFFLSDGVA